MEINMKNKRLLKIYVCLAAAVLTGMLLAAGGKLSVLPVIDVDAAASNTYNMTDSYKSGKYYENLTSLTLTGDKARDVMAVAMSQIGYHEGNSEGELHGGSTDGSHDFAEYNVLYGKLDNGQGNGLSYGYYWCASFVNWCLRLAGVDEEASGGEVSCNRWYEDCRELNIFRSKSGYIPSYGDIIFFKDKGSSLASTHVGLVRYSDGAYVYTVEGNTSNGSEYSSNGEYVALKKHSMSSSYIVGYASPDYKDGGSAHAVDYSGGFLSLGQYISTSELELFSDAELQNMKNESIPAFSLFSVKLIGENSLKVEYDGNEGYIADGGFSQLNTAEMIYTVNYIGDNGVIMYMPQYRRIGEPKSIYANKPERADSGFVGWRLQGSNDTVLESGSALPGTAENIILSAVWDSNYYVVSFVNTDGSIIGQFHGYYGTEYELPSPEAPDGYVFSGWGAEPDGVIKGNATYTASYIHESELEAAVAETDSGKDKSTGCSSSISGICLTASAAAVGISFVFKSKRPRRQR